MFRGGIMNPTYRLLNPMANGLGGTPMRFFDTYKIGLAHDGEI